MVKGVCLFVSVVALWPCQETPLLSAAFSALSSGAAHSTAHTIRPSFEIIKTKPGAKIVSSVFLMALQDRDANPTAQFSRALVFPLAEPEDNPTILDLPHLRKDTVLYFSPADGSMQSLGMVQLAQKISALIGVLGPRGPVGYRGPTGYRGPEGYRGPYGYQGEAGPQGERGIIGPTGFQGMPGENGTNGTNGTHGRDGINGTDGEPGPRGPTGYRGETGYRGQDGKDGEDGDRGPTGYRGATGYQGPPGEPGADGADGTCECTCGY